MWQVVILLLHAAEASKVVGQTQPATSNEKENTTTVLQHVVKHLSPGDMIIGKRLEDLPAYVELGEDPVNLLPPAFTICSTAMALTGDIVFFTLLDEEGKQVLSVHLSNDEVRKNGRRQSNPAIFVVDSASLALPVLGLFFPQSWVRSCLAVSTYSGLVQWVAEGELVTNRTLEVLTQEGVLPQALAGKLLLGTLEYGVSGTQAVGRSQT